MALRVLVIGRQFGEPPPGLPESRSGARYVFADELETVRAHLGDAEAVFHYGQPRDALRLLWPLAGRLRWVHIGNVGVDWALFPELIESDVIVTNSRGIFDFSLPEYTLALMLALAKDLPGTFRSQRAERWQHRPLEPLAGGRVLIVGAGSIARSTARLLQALSMSVTLVGRTERASDQPGGRIRAIVDLHTLLPEADWLICAAPLTAATHALIGAVELGLLPKGARIVNIGRGPVVVTSALIEALASGALGGAALDVFETEPLPSGHPLWSMPNVIVSPHIGGDVGDTALALTQSFLTNLNRYLGALPLRDVVDKHLGFVPTSN